jgi:hypothetical protein
LFHWRRRLRRHQILYSPSCSSTLCSSGAESYPHLPFPQHCSPSSIAIAQRLGLAVKSQDPGARPLPDGAMKRVNCRSTRLPHRLNRSGVIAEPDGLASRDGRASGGGASRVGEVGEDDGEGSVRGANGPWGRPSGSMVMHAVQHITGDYRDATLIVFFFSSLLLPLTAR